MSDTPLYDGLLAALIARARSGEGATAALAAAQGLHTAGPDGTCGGCGLESPCPTSRLLVGALDTDGARREVRRTLVGRAVAAAGRPALDPVETDDVERPVPVMPSAAELFAPNPGTARALDALLGTASGV